MFFSTSSQELLLCHGFTTKKCMGSSAAVCCSELHNSISFTNCRRRLAGLQPTTLQTMERQATANASHHCWCFAFFSNVIAC